jgi:hypothetical protein
MLGKEKAAFGPPNDSHPTAVDPAPSIPSHINAEDVNQSNDPEHARGIDPEIASPFQPFNFGEQPSVGEFDSFNFTFDEVPSAIVADDSGFVFDQNDQSPQQNAGDQLFARFRDLLSNPCFAPTDASVAELFKHEDETESVDTAYSILVGEE